MAKAKPEDQREERKKRRGERTKNPSRGRSKADGKKDGKPQKGKFREWVDALVFAVVVMLIAPPLVTRGVVNEVVPAIVVALSAVNVPACAEFPPIIVASISPPSISTLLIFTSPVPFGVMSIFPLLPFVMVMDPVAVFPVLSIRS